MPTAIALAVLAALPLASGRALPLPGDAALRGTVESDGIHEIPELKGARANRMRDESLSGVRTLDQTWTSDVDYADAVRFYDRQLGRDDVLERDHAATATGWLVRFADDGTFASIVVRNTDPTTIEIQRTVP